MPSAGEAACLQQAESEGEGVQHWCGSEQKKTADGISKIAPPTRMAVGSSTAWAFKIDTVLHMLPE